LEIGEKLGKFWLTYQPHSSSADSARELFKPSKDLASLRVCNEKIFLVLGFGFFVSDIRGRFLAIFACWYPTWTQLLDGSILLKFSLETRLELESFETLIDFLAFLVQNYGLK